MRKLILIVMIAGLAAGLAGAGGLDTQFGLGYNAQYFGDLADATSDILGDAAWMPYGIGGYAGFGYGFGDRKIFSLGGELALNMGVQFNSAAGFYIGNIAVQGRGYAKIKPGRLLSITGFGGGVYDIYGGAENDVDFSLREFSWVAGARVTLWFLYASWDMSFYEEPLPTRHNFGLGIAFSR